jgi:tetratricopeptide (TPR) repeat protein
LSNATFDDTSRGRVFLAKAHALITKGDMVGSIAWCQRALVLALQIEDDDLVYDAELLMSYASPDYDETIASMQRVRDEMHKTGDTLREVDAYQAMGYRMTLEGHYQQALEALNMAVKILAVGKSDYYRAFKGQWGPGQVYLAQGDYAHARSALELSIAIARDHGECASPVLVHLGTVGLYTGDPDLARHALGECFDWEYRHDNMERLAQGLVLGAGLAHVLGKLNTAAQLLGATAAIRKVHHTHGVGERELFHEYDLRLPAVRAAMEPAAFVLAWESGEDWTLKEAMAVALAL